MKSLRICLPVLAIVLMVSSSASARQYVVYRGAWQETLSPEQAPADVKQAPTQAPVQAPMADQGCGCGGWSSCDSCCTGCCTGWWSNYCRERHHGCHRHAACCGGGYGMGCGGCEVPACDAGISYGCGGGHWGHGHCGLFRHHRQGGYGGYGCGCDSGWDMGCGDKGASEAIEGKSDIPAEPPTPMPEEAGSDKSARSFGRIYRW